MKLKRAISTDPTNSCNKIWNDIQEYVSPWFIRRWAESRFANGDPIVNIPEAKIHHIVVKTTENEYIALLDKSIEIRSNLVMATINDISSYYDQFRKASMHIRLHDDNGYFNANGTQRTD
jgi:hypothetical protein